MKADQWRTLSHVLFLALYVAWQEDGQIPDRDAPVPASNTKVAQSCVKIAKLHRRRLSEHLEATNPDAAEEDYDEIESIEPDRNFLHHYDTVLQFCSSIRILATQSITGAEAKRGCRSLSRACQRWAMMHCHLTPYFHLCGHLEEQFAWLGPCYGWWLYGFERHNGDLGKFNINGHSGGELECTMMRSWWKSILIHDLVCLPFASIPSTDIYC